MLTEVIVPIVVFYADSGHYADRGHCADIVLVIVLKAVIVTSRVNKPRVTALSLSTVVAGWGAGCWVYRVGVGCIRDDAVCKGPVRGVGCGQPVWDEWGVGGQCGV